MKLTAAILMGVILATGYAAKPSSKTYGDVIDRRAGHTPRFVIHTIGFAEFVYEEGRAEYQLGKDGQQPIDTSFYVPGKDASSQL